MRPVRLEMDGFASFRSQTTVDFEGADYFTLVGPTGAGKSTVIDAMVFALYGSAPRWGRANSVQYALAPTTTKATVRLVFDIGDQRFQVAREVRRVGQNIQQKSAVLERFDDPLKPSATSDEVDVLASEVRDVTPAVEELLGLSFDDFTKAVVLPQGRFAEFLNATVGERQDILLKLLGAHQYDIVMRAAGARRSAADSELVAIDARIGDLGGATKESADEAAARVEELRLLSERIGSLQAEVDDARDGARRAGESAKAAAANVRRLEAVQIPEGISDLAERSATVRDEADHRRAAAAEAESAYSEAREALEAGGNRSLLERMRDQWAELSTLVGSLPALESNVERTASGVTQADEARLAAEEAWSAAFSAQAVATREVEAAEAALTALTARREAIASLQAPAGLNDLAQRLDGASSAVEAAAEAVAEAEAAEDHARAALRDAGDPAELSAQASRLESAVTLQARIEDLTRRSATAATALGDAHVMAQTSEADVAAARAHAESARLLVTAAGLRASLEVGHECPVCTTTVATLPSPIDAAEADAADGRLRQAELVARSAREAVTRAEAEVAAQARALADARSQLSTLVPDGGDPAQLREAAVGALAKVAEARDAAETAASARAEARAAHSSAVAQASALEAERRDALTALREARGSVLAYGAPVAEAGSLQESWHELTAWASTELADLDTVTLPEATSTRETTAAARSAADKTLSDAAAERTRVTAAADAARSALLRAEAALSRAHERSEQLTQLLDGAPDAAEVSASLEILTGLERAERTALDGLRAAGRARDAAVAAERALRDELATADAQLRETREPLVPLGAPAVDTSDLPAAWAALAKWAATARTSADEALAKAETTAAEAGAAVTSAEQALTEAALDGGLEVSSAAQVAVAVATESARARDRHAAITRDLERLAGLHEQRAEAEQRRQVASMLADHLSAKKFQRWLAGAALDVLVEAASSSLLELSGGQFTLSHDKGEFHVIDHTDAEARRSVRTLSGGETFQASLALALALSAELSSMSSNAAKLDSIFLDEGFGSLDPDSLEVVALTLERLAQGDRLVGVVTHVQGLAERIPTRFTVSRTSRTSTVVREG